MMLGHIKTLLDFLEQNGKIRKTENVSDEIETEYHIELNPDQHELFLTELKRLQEATDCRVGIWFYYDTEEDVNKCQIDLQVLKK